MTKTKDQIKTFYALSNF